MAYEFVYTHRAVRDIEVLDPLARKRLGKKLEALKQNPRRTAQKLIDSKLGQYRWRIGDYRVIFDLHGEKVVILRVGHRREIYR